MKAWFTAAGKVGALEANAVDRENKIEAECS